MSSAVRHSSVIKIQCHRLTSAERSARSTALTILRLHTAVGSAVGALIGTVAGSGKGVAIGTVVGAGAGAGSVDVEGRNNFDLSSGSQLTILASAPVQR